MSRSAYGITASFLLTPRQRIPDPLLVLEDGRIAFAGPREGAEIPPNMRLLDFPGAVLAPGLVDIHIHGGGGHDVMEGDDSALARIESHLAATGVTSYLPTTVTAPLDTTLVALERLAARIESAENSSGDLRAQPLGIHLEGPFLSHAKRGVHPAEHLLPPTGKLFDRLWEAARGHVRLMTIAPELPGALEVIAGAAGRGVCVSLGHSNSEREPVLAAIRAGARHATHTFNAMRPLDHREPGILGTVLADNRLTADIIADGVHVHPDMVALFLRAKGAEGAVLITDALSATGVGDGRYRLGGFEVDVRGQLCTHNGTIAGSVLTLDRALRNIMEFAGWELHDSVPLASLNPARVANVAMRGQSASPWKGALEPGADADIVVLSAAGEVIRTIVRGAGV